MKCAASPGGTFKPDCMCAARFGQQNGIATPLPLDFAKRDIAGENGGSMNIRQTRLLRWSHGIL
jgi:hypothetical protein